MQVIFELKLMAFGTGNNIYWMFRDIGQHLRVVRVARIVIPGVPHYVHLAPTPQREKDLARA